MRPYAFLNVLLTTSLLTAPVLANDLYRVSSGDDLQRKAERILQSEPGAKQVTVREEVAPIIDPNPHRVINLDSFDLNHDGFFEHDEIGQVLFRIFDADDNLIIDNIEYTIPRIASFTPMKKKTVDTVVYRDYYKSTKVTVSQEEFLQLSRLSRFDRGQDGVSAKDFLEMPFNLVNADKTDKVIRIEEWKRAYADSVKPRHMEPYNYNDGK